MTQQPQSVPEGMTEKKIKSTLPIYIMGAAWLAAGFVFPPYRLWHIAVCAAVGLAAYVIASRVIPPRVVLTPAPAPAFATGDGALDASLAAAREQLAQLHKMNEQITDEAVSADIARMEQAGKLILDEVAQHPEKAKKIRRFCTYYLPTAVKIMQQYAQTQHIRTEEGNVAEMRRRIAEGASTFAGAFEQQLDALFSAEVLDVSTDLETMKAVQSMDANTKTEF